MCIITFIKYLQSKQDVVNLLSVHFGRIKAIQISLNNNKTVLSLHLMEN